MRPRAKRRARQQEPSAYDELKDAAEGLFRRAIDMAERDPEQFKDEFKRVGKRAGEAIETAYQMVRSDPDLPKKKIGNVLIRAAARTIKREMG